MAEQGVLKAVLKGRLNDAVETRNIFTYGATIPEWSSYDEPHDKQAVKNGVVAIVDAVKGILSELIDFYEIEIYEWNGTHWVAPVSYQIMKMGTVAGDMSSYQTSVLYTLTTQTAKALGRKFFPGMAESMTTGGGLAIGAMSTAVAVVAEIIAERANGGRVWYPGIVSKSSPFIPFVGGAVGTILSTIRRRKPGYGI